MPARRCDICGHWEPLCEGEENHAGLCRKFALAPSFDGWPITEAGDWCEAWAGDGVREQEQSTFRPASQPVVRTRVRYSDASHIPLRAEAEPHAFR